MSQAVSFKKETSIITTTTNHKL